MGETWGNLPSVCLGVSDSHCCRLKVSALNTGGQKASQSFSDLETNTSDEPGLRLVVSLLTRLSPKPESEGILRWSPHWPYLRWLASWVPGWAYSVVCLWTDLQSWLLALVEITDSVWRRSQLRPWSLSSGYAVTESSLYLGIKPGVRMVALAVLTSLRTDLCPDNFYRLWSQPWSLQELALA